MEVRRKLAQIEAEWIARKQMELNYEAAPKAPRRQEPKKLRQSGESSTHVRRLLELAAKVPNQVEQRSPIQSSLHPARFL